MDKLNSPDISAELKGIKFISLILLSITVISSIADRILSNNIISFMAILEWLLIFGIYRGYIVSMRKFNYGLWGFSFLIFLMLIRNIIHFSIFNSAGFLLYANVFGLCIFFINTYIISSPIYYPRVQWWEYDYQYRADLKINIKVNEQLYNARLTDLRRNEASVELFEHIPIEATGVIIFNDLNEVSFQIKSSKNIITGRPIRYGLSLHKKSKDLVTLKKIWSDNKFAKLRNKFKK